MIYLDHAATTRPYAAVIDYITKQAEEDFFNPAAAYRPAIRVEKQINRSLQQIGSTIGAKAAELIVTSGATESINTVFKGYCPLKKRQGTHLVICSGDHPATLESAAYMESLGWTVHRLPLAPTGEPDLAALEVVLKQVGDSVVLVSLPAVNNETGAVTPLSEVRAQLDHLAPAAALHVDCVQAWTRLPLDLGTTGIDFASFSGHKIGGPKRIGLLYMRSGLRLEPLLHGGGQQKGRRSGTEAAVPVAALALAAEIGNREREEDFLYVQDLRKSFLQGLTAAGLVFRVNASETAIPHILSVSFPGIRGETLLHMLEDREIYLSTGSACGAGKKTVSHVLRALNLSHELALGTVRLSFSRENTAAEIAEAVRAVKSGVEALTALRQ